MMEDERNTERNSSKKLKKLKGSSFERDAQPDLRVCTKNKELLGYSSPSKGSYKKKI